MLSDRFRSAAESKDFSNFEEIFAEDVTFRSPAVFKPYEGRDAVAMILTTVGRVFENFRYTDQVETGDAAALAFSATVGARDLNLGLILVNARGHTLYLFAKDRNAKSSCNAARGSGRLSSAEASRLPAPASISRC